jgi:BirA family biotin operon repressor/biotin-[acetyl-CoA-carboxylase] ligase
MELIHLHFETLSSTNDWAKRNLHSFDRSKLTLISAETQTAGRGQYGRKWISPSKINLYLTYCFFPEKEQEPYMLTHLLAFSVIQTLAPLPCHIKWPNDVIIKGKKIAGILCEVVPFATQQGVVLGIGLNVNMGREALETISQPATSLLQETGSPQDLQSLLLRLTNRFSSDLELFLAKGLTPFERSLSRYRSFRTGLGEQASHANTYQNPYP